MLKIDGRIDLDNTLTKTGIDIEPFDDFVDYLNSLIHSKYDLEQTFTIPSSDFGPIQCKIFMDYPINDITGKFEIRFTLTFEDYDQDEKTWYDVEYDKFIESLLTIETIRNSLEDYVKELNKQISEIIFPENTSLIIKDNKIYMELWDLGRTTINVDYTTLQVEEAIYLEEVTDGIL